MSFGQPFTGLVAQQWAVVEDWGGEVQCPVEEDLAGGGTEEIGPAHHFGDLHGVVIDHDGELVGRGIILAPDHEVTEVFSGDELLCSLASVLERDGFAVGNAEAPVYPWR